jgi:hypothetical protein
MYTLRVLYERVGDASVGGDMIRFAGIPYRLKIYEYSLDGGERLKGGVAYLTVTDESLQLLSKDKNLVLKTESGEKFSFEFIDVATGKLAIKFKKTSGV